MNNTPLTAEQKLFAAEKHDTIGSFLKIKRLNYDEFYDVVIFAFLEAVRTYCECFELRNEYTFQSVAFRGMECDLIDYYRAQNTQKRKADIVSLDSLIQYDDNEMLISEVVGISDKLAADMETGFLWDEIKKKLSHNQFDMLRMKAAGYSDREIAGHYGVPVKVIKYTSLKIQDSLKDVCLV